MVWVFPLLRDDVVWETTNSIILPSSSEGYGTGCPNLTLGGACIERFDPRSIFNKLASCVDSVTGGALFL
jgi:hypothetical protein